MLNFVRIIKSSDDLDFGFIQTQLRNVFFAVHFYFHYNKKVLPTRYLL